MPLVPIDRSLLLTIAGCPVRYYSGVAPAPLLIPGAGRDLYTDVPMLKSVGAWTEGVRLTGGVGEYSSVEVSLHTRSTLASDTDPAYVLGRMGWQGADAWAQLAVSLDGTGTTVELDRSMGLVAGDLIHIGRETIRVGAVGGGGLTLTGCTRAVGRTVQVPHLVSSNGGPFVTRPLTYYRGRDAWLSVADYSAPGAYREVMAGRITGSPTVDGVEVRLALTPWPALLAGKLGAPAPEVGLVQNWHAFQAGRGCIVEFAEVIPGVTVGYSTAYAASTLTLAGPGVAGWEHQAHFDPGLPATHPRRGLLRRDASGSTDQPAAYPAANQIQVAGTVGWAAGGGDTVSQAGCAELFRVDATAGSAVDVILPWPQCLLASWAARCQTGDHTTDPGGWVDVALYPDAGRCGFKRTAFNAPGGAGGPYDVRVVTAFSSRVDWGEVAGVPCADWATGQPENSTVRERLWCAVDLRPRGSTERQHNYSVPFDDAGQQVDIGGVATAWYQRGEPYLLIEPAPDGTPPVVMPATGFAYVVLSGSETTPESPAGQGGSTGSWLLEVSAIDAVELGGVGGQAAYRLTITDRSRWAATPGGMATGPLAVVDWPGQQRASVQQVVAAAGRRWTRLVSDLLTSPGPLSTLPAGVGLPLAGVDIGDTDGGLPTVRSVIDAETAVDDLANGWLRATGQALVLKRSTAGVVLSLRPVGLEAPSALADATLSDAGMAAGVAPVSDTADDVVTAVQLLVDWDLSGESTRTITLVDQGAQGVAGESSALEVQLRGVSLADPTEAVPLALSIGGRISAAAGYPRRLWRVRVPMAWAATVSLGDTIAVTSSLLRGYGPALGVTSATGRVIEMQFAPMDAMCDLTIAHHGHLGAGWAPALEVTGILSPTQVQVAVAAYSDDDLSWWTVGDAVRCVPIGATDAAVVTTVQLIGVGTVTTTAAHGLNIGDRLEPGVVPGAAMAGLAFLDDGSRFS